MEIGVNIATSIKNTIANKLDIVFFNQVTFAIWLSYSADSLTFVFEISRSKACPVACIISGGICNCRLFLWDFGCLGLA